MDEQKIFADPLRIQDFRSGHKIWHFTKSGIEQAYSPYSNGQDARSTSQQATAIP